MSREDWLTVFVLQHPVGVGSVELAIGTYHLGLDPEPERDVVPMTGLDQWGESVGEFIFIDPPVTQ